MPFLRKRRPDFKCSQKFNKKNFGHRRNFTAINRQNDTKFNFKQLFTQTNLIDMAVKDKYQSVLALGEKIGVQNGKVEEADGVLRVW